MHLQERVILLLNGLQMTRQFGRDIRKLAWSDGSIVSAIRKGAEDERSVYGNYYEYEEPLKKIVPHRVLALNRGEKEDVLRVGVSFPVERIIGRLERELIRKTHSPSAAQVKEAIEDAFKRLIAPSIEREIRAALTEKAEEQAIHVFSENLKSLLVATTFERESRFRCRPGLSERVVNWLLSMKLGNCLKYP